MASILLVGPGAIGATLATWLAQDERHESPSRPWSG
jgi:predicted dinucleotide-binding enzyme